MARHMSYFQAPAYVLRNGHKTFFRIGQEDDIDQDNISNGPLNRSPTRRHFIGGVLFIIFNLAIFSYWAAFPLLNTQFFHGNARLGSVSGEFRSARYGWDWWHIWLLTLNGLAPLFLVMALTENRIQEYAKAHGFICGLLILVNIWILVVLSFRWCAVCNRQGTAHNTACNDYKWCGVYFGANAEAMQWCSNGIPFTPPVVSSQLKRNAEYFQHWIFCFIFLLLNVWNFGVQKSLTDFRIFSNEAF